MGATNESEDDRDGGASEGESAFFQWWRSCDKLGINQEIT